MRILMISDFYPPFVGGVEVLVSSLSRDLVRRGHEVAVATLAGPGLPARALDAGVRVHRVRSTSQRIGPLFATQTRPWAPPAPDPGAVVGLRSILRRERPDVVHGHDWLARSFLPLKRRHGAALVMSLHYYTLNCPKKSLMYDGVPCAGPALTKCLRCAGGHYGPLKGTAVVLGQRVFASAEARLVDLFAPVSEAVAARSGLSEAGLEYAVVPNLVPQPPPLGPAASLLDALPAEPFLLFVGDIRPEKGAQILLEAYRRLPSPPPLVLLGKVWGDTEIRLPEGAILLRDWPNSAVRAAMSRCLALVVPSVWPEPFGIVVAEALAAGRPVVASAVGGIPEVVTDGREALLVAPGDTASLADALARMVGDERLREQMAVHALARAGHYSADAVIPLLESVYRRACAR